MAVACFAFVSVLQLFEVEEIDYPIVSCMVCLLLFYIEAVGAVLDLLILDWGFQEYLAGNSVVVV